MENSHHTFGARICSLCIREAVLVIRRTTITLVLDFVPFVSEKQLEESR